MRVCVFYFLLFSCYSVVVVQVCLVGERISRLFSHRFGPPNESYVNWNVQVYEACVRNLKMIDVEMLRKLLK